MRQTALQEKDDQQDDEDQQKNTTTDVHLEPPFDSPHAFRTRSTAEINTVH
jgi:hypothetical protein